MDSLVRVDWLLLVMVMIIVFMCLMMGMMVSSLVVLLELEMVMKILCVVIMFRLLCVVLVGCMNNEGVLVEVRVVVILWLIWLDLLIFEIIVCFLYCSKVCMVSVRGLVLLLCRWFFRVRMVLVLICRVWCVSLMVWWVVLVEKDVGVVLLLVIFIIEV